MPKFAIGQHVFVDGGEVWDDGAWHKWRAMAEIANIPQPDLVSQMMGATFYDVRLIENTDAREAGEIVSKREDQIYTDPH